MTNEELKSALAYGINLCELTKTTQVRISLNAAVEILAALDNQAPYQEDKVPDHGDYCLVTLHKDAIELLKAQEPRVMTLDEVADLEEHQFVWIEISNSDEPVYCLEIVRFRGVLCVNLEITLNAFRDVVIVYTKNYNKEYRFWTDRPSDKQRKAVKWDE